jgi:SAM-dependent methyltransferase
MRSLEETPLELGRAEVEAAIRPHIVKRTSKDDRDWRASVVAQRHKARKTLIKRLLGLRRPRDQALVAREYEAHWERRGYGLYCPSTSPPDRGDPWEWGENAYLMPSVGGARARLLYIARVIQWLRPASVFEVGFGNGVNLLPLACQFPEVRFSGLELTAEGVARVTSAQREPELPAALRAFSPDPIRDASAHHRVEVFQGSAAEMPFPNGAFDLVFSSLALEQMERIRPRVLAEFSRISARYTVMLEPFRETNGAGFPREYVLAMNYFRGSIAELANYRLRPILETGDMPTECWLHPCLVVSQRVGL